MPVELLTKIIFQIVQAELDVHEEGIHTTTLALLLTSRDLNRLT